MQVILVFCLLSTDSTGKPSSILVLISSSKKYLLSIDYSTKFHITSLTRNTPALILSLTLTKDIVFDQVTKDTYTKNVPHLLPNLTLSQIASVSTSSTWASPPCVPQNGNAAGEGAMQPAPCSEASTAGPTAASSDTAWLWQTANAGTKSKSLKNNTMHLELMLSGTLFLVLIN